LHTVQALSYTTGYIRLFDGATQTLSNNFCNMDGNCRLSLWSLEIENKKQKRQQVRVRSNRIKDMGAAVLDFYFEYHALCALKNGTFLEMNIRKGEVAVWETIPSNSSKTQWRCNKIFCTNRTERLVTIQPFEIYDGVLAMGRKKDIFVLENSGNYHLRSSFKVSNGDLTHATTVSFSIRDSHNQDGETQKRLLCTLSNRGCLYFWDLESGGLVGETQSELLSKVVYMKSGVSSATGDVVLLIGTNQSNPKTRLFSNIIIVEVVPLLYGDAITASPPTSTSTSFLSSVYENALADNLSYRHFREVTHLELMENGDILSTSRDCIIKQWSSDGRQLIRSFYQSSPEYPPSTVKSVGGDRFISLSSEILGFRVKRWSTHHPERPVTEEIWSKWKTYSIG